ncbi:MAG: hypothetical protein EA341_08530 [Mongoliibacter sp.]|uniref:hypothetical protein n=1 Tax=Mongoliibacter sp. TaxID=2022438 RepID=UPI0012F0B31E|nr:hypothetical protein [Mongoliibacter sp.]TVP50002.1 MAG: hypothetical protein EA341_08530 [Mongoliibacter sp.]
MKSFAVFGILLVLCACGTIDEPPNNEEITEEVTPRKNRNICAFDLSDVDGDFDLFGKWEFVAFQEAESGNLDQLTCMARWAEFALAGEDYDNVFQITLDILESHGNTENKTMFDFNIRTFSYEYFGQIELTIDTLLFLIDTIATKYHPNPASSTLPAHEFEARFFENLRETKVYHLDNNKLYLYGKHGDQRMTFLALED